jgi:hypothetical protein
MRISGLLAAVIALSVLAPIAPGSRLTPTLSKSSMARSRSASGCLTLRVERSTWLTPIGHLRTIQIGEPRSFRAPRALHFGAYIAWETTYHPPALPIIDPVVAAFSPVDPIGLPGGGALVDPI